MSYFAYAPDGAGSIPKKIQRENQLTHKVLGPDENDEPWISPLKARPESTYPDFDYYPCEITGEGSMPAVEDLTWANGKYTGEMVTPPVSRNITPREFKKRFTQAEISAIYAAAKVSGDVQSYIDDLNMAPYVDLDLPENRTGLDALVTAGLLVAGRPDELLA